MSYGYAKGILAILLLIGLQVANADSPVWKVSNGKTHIYLGGTIHILTRQDYPLPKAFDQAYEQADILYLEADIEKLQDPRYQGALLNGMVYQDGRNLQKVLSRNTYQQLSAYLQARGIPIANMLPLKPGWLSVALTTLELDKLGLLGEGVDQYYGQRAKHDHKTIAYLEDVGEQIGFISSMGDGREDELIAHTLYELQSLPALMADTKQAWREGDAERMHELFNTPMIDKFPEIYQSINVDRNHNWQPQLESLFQTPGIEYVLVGALHLVGPDGLIAYFKRQGYKIEML